MSDSFEQGLRRVMVALGHLLERAITGAKKARVQVETRGGLQPVLSLESQIPLLKIRTLIAASEDRIFQNSIPGLGGKQVLEIAEGPVRFLPRFLQLGAARAVGVEIGGQSLGRQGDVSRGYVLRGLASALPFADGSIDYVVARFATPQQGDFIKAMKEVGRVMVAGGQGVIADYHPFGLYARRGGERLRSAQSPIGGLEDYYRLCKSSGLRVVEVKEALLDETLRSHFSEEEIHAYRSLKGTPLVVFLFVYKPKLKKP